MLLRTHMFRRVTILGVGLMGGSLGMAIKKHGLAREVVGFSSKQSSLMHAMKVGAIDIALTDLKEAVQNAELIVLATPVDTIIKILNSIKPYLRRGCIVTDLGSAKVEIVQVGERSLPDGSFFIGSHPLVGSEKKGIEFASADLFEGETCLVTPTTKTNEITKKKIKFLWTKLGGKVKSLTPEEHDQILAYISHLPHLIAYSLIETIPQQCLEYTTQSLKDTTRIAASSPQMWNDICLANSKNVVHALDDLIKHLSYLRKSIVTRDTKGLIHHFTKAKEKRDSIQPGT